MHQCRQEASVFPFLNQEIGTCFIKNLVNCYLFEYSVIKVSVFELPKNLKKVFDIVRYLPKKVLQ